MDIQVNNHTYALKYCLKFNSNEGKGFTEKEAIEDGMHTCDALMILNFIKPKDSPLSIEFFSIDGKNDGKQISSEDAFGAWSLMAHHLSKDLSIPSLQRKIAKQAVESVSDFIKVTRQKEADNDD
jgi:hypothetical protein